MQKNDVRLLFDRANEEWDAGNTKQAFKLFSAAVKQGELSALVSLGFFYDLGIGVSKDKRKALQLYKQAARSGLVFALSNIGTVYRDIGDFTRARLWFLKAFKSGDGDAALELAKLYLKREAKGDIVRASKYLQLAINSKFITESSVEEAELLLKRLKQQAAHGKNRHTVLKNASSRIERIKKVSPAPAAGPATRPGKRPSTPARAGARGRSLKAKKRKT